MRILPWASFVVAVVAATAVPSGCGTPSCVLDDDCDTGFACVESPEDPDLRVCRPACAADIRCPAGQACVKNEDGDLEGVCLVLPGDKAPGEDCTDDLQCTTGACGPGTPDATENELICVETCDVETPCPDDALRCTLDGLQYVCVAPLDDRAAGEACDDPRECLSGTCVVRPAVDGAPADPVCADNCSATVPCQDPSRVCVRLEGGARACLEALEDGARCTSKDSCVGGFCIEDVDGKAVCASACVAGGCEDGFACVKDEDGNDVCMPALDDRADLEPCESARECASGHCVSFAGAGVLCASPCGDGGTCPAELVCYLDANDAPTFCGPTP